MYIDSSENFMLTGRGSTSLYVVLKSLPYRSIIVPANICEVVVAVIKHCGYTITFSDISMSSGNSELLEIKQAYTGTEKVLLAVPNFGLAIDMKSVHTWAKNNGLFTILDLCNAPELKWGNESLNTYTDAAIYSFGYAKPIEIGFGGGLSVKDDEIFEVCRATYSTIKIYDQDYGRKATELSNQISLLRRNKVNDTRFAHLYSQHLDVLIYRLNKEQNNQLSKDLSKYDWEKNLMERTEKALILKNSIEGKHIVIRNEKNDIPIWRFTFLCKDEEEKTRLIKTIRSKDLIASSWYPRVVEMFYDSYNRTNHPNALAFGKRVINLFIDHRVSTDDTQKTAQLILDIT